jgi:acetoin utilization protein AcuB
MPRTMEELMTSAPQTIGADVTIEAARRMMDAFGIRHLPVRSEGRLVGVVSAADVARSAAHRPVCEVMNSDPLVVTPLDSAETVALAMADRHSDAAIVVSEQRVVGIFTGTDAARALAATLHALDERR